MTSMKRTLIPLENVSDSELEHLGREYIVTNMECRFPAVLVSWLGREFYRGIYGNAGEIEPSTPDLGDKLSDHFGDEMWDLKSARIFLISLLRTEIRIYLDDSM
ncbi:hypothetical protein AVEN_53950-1 [Araneus ventricosus]|uniref:Uncharacterized protein n=1 Tax=Araneus ventricosus TaxID=182803 RepID=A0A4Y2JIH9_ARAVE|nr:hypothetical protein AVEN_53950-1 [Araneus ventricosus]